MDAAPALFSTSSTAPPRSSGNSLIVARLRRSARLAPALVLAWTLATLFAAYLSGAARLSGLPLGEVAYRSLFAGLLVGLCAAWLEANVLPRWGRRLPVPVVLLLQTVAYGLIVFTAACTLAGLVWIRSSHSLGTEVRDVRAFVSTWALGELFVILTLSSFVINLGTQLRRALGPGMLTALLVGRYRMPVAEERAFVFLDLNDSTAIAEALGPLRFTAFKSDFFADIAEPVLNTNGRIVQYIGDEVMVTWPMRWATQSGAPVRFFFFVEQVVEEWAARYRARYGFVPQFTAGIHGGDVVTAQVGDIHRDIVHSGDVVNTAARIATECRARGRRLLVSAEFLRQMRLPEGFDVEDLGPIQLRGKENALQICSIERHRSSRA